MNVVEREVEERKVDGQGSGRYWHGKRRKEYHHGTLETVGVTSPAHLVLVLVASCFCVASESWHNQPNLGLRQRHRKVPCAAAEIEMGVEGSASNQSANRMGYLLESDCAALMDKGRKDLETMVDGIATEAEAEGYPDVVVNTFLCRKS